MGCLLTSKNQYKKVAGGAILKIVSYILFNDACGRMVGSKSVTTYSALDGPHVAGFLLKYMFYLNDVCGSDVCGSDVCGSDESVSEQVKK